MAVLSSFLPSPNALFSKFFTLFYDFFSFLQKSPCRHGQILCHSGFFRIQCNRQKEVLTVKKLSFIIGICLLSAGIGVLLSMFLPDVLLVSIEALLLIVAGFLIICSK